MMDYIQEEQETLVEILQGFVPKKEERRLAIEHLMIFWQQALLPMPV